MAHAHRLSQWTQVVSTAMPSLSRSQADTSAAYSFGMVMTGRVGQSVIAHYLAALQDDPENNVRQRLREWCYAASDKRGPQRRAVQVQDCFESLLRWGLDRWTSESHQLVSVCDTTNLRQTFTVLAVSLVYRGCALPVVWSIRAQTAAGSWQDAWLDLLALLAPAVPADWQVFVLTDRGLYSKWLFLGIVAQGWHPLLCINSQGFPVCARRAIGIGWLRSLIIQVARGHRKSSASVANQLNWSVPCSRVGQSVTVRLGWSGPTCQRQKLTSNGIVCALGRSVASKP